jgi:thioredoxin reductase
MFKDYIIIGAGPAGLQLGHLMQKHNENYLILESGENVGSFFRTYPRHRQLISINKRYTGETDQERNMRMDWNSLLSEDKEMRFTDYTGKYFPPADDYVKYLEDFHNVHDIQIKFNQRVTEIEKDGLFTLHTEDGSQYQCKYLIMATGVSKENIPDIPGIELCEKYSQTNIDPKNYINQRVLVLGKGNSAFETADNLIETTAYIHVAGRSSIKLAWQTHYVGHLRAVNNNILDSYQLKSQNAILDGDVISIEKVNDDYAVRFSFSRSGEVEKTLHYDRVICCTGFKFDADIFSDECRPMLTLNERFPKMKSDWESENVENLYFAGTIMQQRDFKKSTCGFVHGFRYAVRSLFHTLITKNNGTDLPHRELQLNADVLAGFIAERVNRTSALWQQFEFLCDTIVLDSKTGSANYIEEIPVEYTHETLMQKHKNFINITLEYGPDHDKVDPFNIDVARVAQDDAENAFNSQYLHPVIRLYQSGELISTHHMAENLENEWNRPESHVLPLKKYLDKSLNMLINAREMVDAV